MNEGTLRRRCMDLLTENPTIVWHYCGDSRSCQGHKGLPDLVMVGENGILFRELKDDYTGTTAEQDLWGWTIRRALLEDGYHRPGGYQLWDVWRPEDLESGRVEKELKAIA